MGIPIFKYEKVELLVCIYEISRELVFIYGISRCSRCLTPVIIVNHYHTLKHCAQFKRGPKIFRKGTKRGPDFEQKGDLKGTKRGPKKGTQNSGCSKNQKEITS